MTRENMNNFCVSPVCQQKLSNHKKSDEFEDKIELKHHDSHDYASMSEKQQHELQLRKL